MFNGKFKGSLEYFFEDENFGGNLWNSHPYLVWENSKFETETWKLGGCNGIHTLYLEHMFPGQQEYLVVLVVMETWFISAEANLFHPTLAK